MYDYITANARMTVRRVVVGVTEDGEDDTLIRVALVGFGLNYDAEGFGETYYEALADAALELNRLALDAVEARRLEAIDEANNLVAVTLDN